MLPELADRVKAMFAGFGAAPLQLNLKSEGVGNDLLKDARLYPQLYSVLGGGHPAWSGERVSTETALNHSVVWACNRIISESVGMLPCVMLRRNGDAHEEAIKHPLYRSLQDAPNAEMTASCFMEMLTGHCVLGGNGYAQIIRRSGTGTAIALRALLPGQVRPSRERTGQKRLMYTVHEGGVPDKNYFVEEGKPQDILHLRGLGWDGIVGYSVITMARQSLGTAIAAEKHVGRFYARGGRLPYNLKLTQKWASDQDAEKFRADWNKIYDNPNEAPILEPWLEYVPTGLNLTDSQMLESRQFEIPEICRWFLVSPHLVGDLSRATFSNVEQLAQQFVTFTLSTWLNRWEKELVRCVLTDAERAQGYYWKHNTNALLRGDFQTRMAGYATMLQNGPYNIDDVRGLEDMNPLPNGAGKAHHIQLNMATLPGTGEPMVAERGILDRMAANANKPAAA
jgi:HK97 family phage portal protein